MKYKNVYNILNRFIHVLTPLLILICSVFANLIYKDDHGGFVGLAIFLNIMISIGWLFIVLFVAYLCNILCKKENSKRIIKLIISIVNLFIWFLGSSILLHYPILVIFNILLIVITGILFYKTKDSIKNV